MNVGCGTTMSKYVSIDGEHQYSERILNMSAVMAAAVGGDVYKRQPYFRADFLTCL